MQGNKNMSVADFVLTGAKILSIPHASDAVTSINYDNFNALLLLKSELNGN